MKSSAKDRMAEAERRIEEARRSRAEALDLGDLALEELPASLGKLTTLRNLSLSGIKFSHERSARGRPRFTDLTPLTGLQELSILDLSASAVTDLTPLADIPKLERLNLFATSVNNLTPLRKLQSLRHLNVSTTAVTNLEPVASLGLCSLHLAHLRLRDLAPVGNIHTLEHLTLAGTAAVKNLTPLANLPLLQDLDLSYTGVNLLCPLAGAQSLQRIDISGAYVNDLEVLLGLRDLHCLRAIDLRVPLSAKLLRDFAGHSNLSELYADNTTAVPPEILSRGVLTSDNCLPRLRDYFNDLDSGAEPENEVKVILLGNGRVGKTQLCRRLRGKPYDESIESTHGVKLHRKELPLKVGGEEETFQVNWWDFGGQDIYHGTHALFLKSRAVFLILWTPELENRDEYFDGEIPLRNQPLAYWLEYVRSLAGEDSPVIVVQSQCDLPQDRAKDPARLERLGFFECCAYSAKEDRGRETLEAHLREAMRYLLQRSGRYEIGQGRAEVRRRLYEWRSEDQELAPEERRHRTLTIAEFQELCEDVGNIISWEHALDYFHQTGVVFYDPELFENQIILDQTWALDAIYAIFHRSRTVPLLRDSGRFTREDLSSIVWQEHSIGEQQLFLDLMASCGVCFPCGETTQGETRYVAPDLLPPFETVEPRLHAWKLSGIPGAPDTPTLRLEYRFFQPATIRGLMSTIGRWSGDLAEYWKYGLWLKDSQRDTQLLVRLIDTRTEEAPGAGALELQAKGADPPGLLREIRNAILLQQIGEEPAESLTLNGTVVTWERLSTGRFGQVLPVDRKLGLAGPCPAFFESQVIVSSEMGISPRRLTEDEKPREVFISYAWGDDSPEGKIRGEVVDRLQEALDSDGFLPVRDRDRMQTGDLISSFINHLTRADRVVAVVSDKYLRSPFCMYEIYRLWQKAQGDPEELARRVVPIVLPDVRIGSFRERAPYLEHWSQEAKSLEELVRNPNLSPSRESWQEVRLVREFAHHVDDILVFLNDVLMPRKLEAHLDDGFGAVRDALRRRLEDES